MKDKKVYGICAAVIAAVFLCGYSDPAVSFAAEEETEAENDGVIADDTVSGWHIVVEDMQVSDSLENVSVSLGYTGVETNDFSKTADKGDTFCLLKLLIEKDGSTETIEWDSLILTDEDENEYFRLEDEFISDLGMIRMPGTSLNFGSNEGWIAYEIPEDADGLTLTYEFEDGTYVCELPEMEN